VNPADYEGWYDTPRGRWIAGVEHALMRELLRPAPGESVLDVGCGTGHFTRLFAADTGGPTVGLDPDREWLAYAAARGGASYVDGRAEALPFPDRRFDCTVSVTALCFVQDQARALREIVRVTRRRFVLGLLNRHSLLYLQKGRGGGSGAYAGAHWHTPSEIRALLAPLPVANVVIRSAVVLPGGGACARAVERAWPQGVLLGGFLAVAADVVPGRRD